MTCIVARRTEDIVVAYAAITRPLVYVEIGVSEGDTFDAVSYFAERAIGCDIRDVRRNKNSRGRFHLCPSDELLSLLSQASVSIDLAFIDGDHSEREVKLDVLGFLPLMATDGAMFIHDTWPRFVEETGAKPEDDRVPWYGDGYKVVEWLKQEERSLGIEVETLPRLNMSVVRIGRKAAPWL